MPAALREARRYPRRRHAASAMRLRRRRRSGYSIDNVPGTGRQEAAEGGNDCHEDDEGAGDLSCPVRRRQGAVQLAEGDRRMGRLARLQGHPDPDLGRAPLRSRQGGELEDLLRRGEGHLPRGRRRDHRAFDAPPGPARRRASGLRHRLRRLRPEGGARQSEGAAEMGRRPDEEGRQGLAESRARRPPSPSPARSPGPISIRGRRARRA